MSRPWISLVLAVLSAGAVLGFLALEGTLTAAGERKLAAAVSGLSVVAAVVLLLLLTLLAGDAVRALRRAAASRRPAPVHAEASPPAREPSVGTKRAGGGS